MKSIFALALSLVVCTGCFHINYVRSGQPAALPVYDQWHHDAVFGLAELSDPVDVDSICPGGFALVTNEISFLNGLVQDLTSSLWNPSTVTVSCRNGAADVTTASGAPVANNR